MIYSIGYQGLAPGRLAAILEHYEAELVDVRSLPSSRIPGYSGKALRERFGMAYRQMGHELGGREPGITVAGVSWLRSEHASGKNLVLMCMEEAPGDCHRHLTIARALMPEIDVRHIYRNEIVRAMELERAIRAGDDEPYDSSPLFG